MSRNQRMSLAMIVAMTTLVPFLTISNFRDMPGHSQEIQTPAIPVNVNLGRSFNQLGIKGSILIYDRNNKKFYEHNAARNSQSFLPASTFKIFNSLVALETGVISNDVAILTWDGMQRQFPTWNQDTNIRQAFRNSTVWFYQVLARKIGHERMEKFIKQVGYGNLQIGTPEQIDRFWLEGPLQITPKQQIEFLQRLHRKELPFSQRTLDLVQDIMIYERTPNYVLRGKTGWAASVTPNIGWFVGYLEQNNNVYFFATNIDIRNNDDAAARIEVTRRSLKALGLL
ncbi:class D beta-lactamase [Anabaena cylindrica FACHB-170]|uniref:class D beta-lactamase n=1 Tax=Anabaena cylindrica TaxID=1165 RepID=UPI0016870F2B|nr:class D beta-lactamase [Anabaena cylindrica]MBD2282375.1 class D beta-lactamase [Anabaena cylindrica FACHB-170]